MNCPNKETVQHEHYILHSVTDCDHTTVTSLKYDNNPVYMAFSISFSLVSKSYNLYPKLSILPKYGNMLITLITGVIDDGTCSKTVSFDSP